MKVGNKSDVREIPTAVVRPRKDTGESVPVVDRVSLSAERAPVARVGDAQVAAAQGREARIAALVQAVRDGTYTPDPQQVASRILETAELEAELRALFSR